MKPITYLKGDATHPQKKPAVITHICNDVGKWGAGFVLALNRRFGKTAGSPEYEYRQWATKGISYSGVPFTRGQRQLIVVEPQLAVCNMVAQSGIRQGTEKVVSYEALKTCLETLTTDISSNNLYKGYSVHMPRIGCGLGGGKWEDIEPLITETLCAQDIEVFVYDL